MQRDINVYDATAFELEFSNSIFEQKLKKQFSGVELGYNGINKNIHSATPREWYVRSWFSVVPFYYINKIVKDNPSLIGDIGCGGNFFKDYYPNIFGIDPHNASADTRARFDEVFSQEHTDFFDSAFTINAIHFISLVDIKDRVLQFQNIIKPGGMGFIALNVARMIEKTPIEDLIKHGWEDNISNGIQDRNHDYNPKCEILEIIENFVRQELTGLLDYKVFDISITQCYNDFMDGNIRIVFQK